MMREGHGQTAPRAVLLTGFEPFGGDEDNVSWAVAARVASSWSPGPDGVHIVTGLLPVAFSRAEGAVGHLLDVTRPSLVLHLGLAAGRSAVGIERVAINLADARIPDNEGQQPVDERLAADGPAARFATVPVKAALVACRERGLPVEASLTAGSFVCNAVLYHSLALAQGRGIPSGFVHLPQVEGHGGGTVPTLELDVMVDAVTAIVNAFVGHRGPDLRLVDGSTH